jgi:class 3 adenylate cyclase
VGANQFRSCYKRPVQPTPERTLITILAADVVGYSALMGRDEPGTLAQLKASRALMADEIARARGRIFNTAGDGLLAEFTSVVNAVDCAVRVQRGLAERNAALPESKRMRVRIGVNLGDVLVDGDDRLGDGVNVAARLQGLAEPGGILISGAVFEQVRNKLAVAFDPLGPQVVKNIAEPISAWRVVLEADRAAPEVATPDRKPEPGPLPKRERTLWQRIRRPVAVAAVLIAFFFTVNLLTWDDRAGFWFQWPSLPILLLVGLRAAWLAGR